MKKTWLDMRSYGLHLFMARHPNGRDHNLVLTGPGCERYRDRMLALGFEHDKRFAHQEYWVRSIKGASHSIIMGQFENAKLVQVPVENIMPALRLQRKNNQATKGAAPRRPVEDKPDAPEQTSSVGAAPSGHATGSPDDAGNHGSAVLGQDDAPVPSDGEPASPDTDGGRGHADNLSDEAAGADDGGVGTGAAGLEAEQPAASGSDPLPESELESPRDTSGEGVNVEAAGGGTDSGRDGVTDKEFVETPIEAPAEEPSADQQGEPETTAVSDEASDADIAAIVRKQIPQMTDAEIELAIAHYGPDHSRTAKLEKALTKRQGDESGDADDEPAEAQPEVTVEPQAEVEPEPAPEPQPTPVAEVEPEGVPQPAPEPEPEQQPVISTGGDGTGFVDGDDEAGDEPAIDRQWAGLTRSDMSLERIGHYSNPVVSLGLLAKAEREGARSLSANERVGVLHFQGWGGVHSDVRTDNGRDSANRSGNSIAAMLGIPKDTFNRMVTENRLESYWTPPWLIESTWNAVERAGVSPEGRYLEPGCGGGHFFVGAPEGVQRHGTMVGVDRDEIACRIAKAVAPDAVVINDDYQNVVLSNDFDAVIGNVPFGETRIHDKRYPAASHIHDYFIVRSLDHLKPGGIMAVLTSSGSMDKESATVRQQIMDRADMLGGFRLPTSVFAPQNAEVTTDLLIFQKRPAGTKPSFDFTGVSTFTTMNDDMGTPITLRCNDYFIQNPENIIGVQEAYIGQFGPKLRTTNVDENGHARTDGRMMAALTERISQTIAEGAAARTKWEVDASKAQQSAGMSEFSADDGVLIDDFEGFVGDYILQDDGSIKEVIDIVDTFDGDGVRNGRRHLAVPLTVSAPEKSILLDYLPLRDAARVMVDGQLNSSDDELAERQQGAKALYDRFVEKHGPVNGVASKVFIEETGAAEVFALELWDDEKAVVDSLSDIFTKRVVRASSDAVIADATDAFYACIDQKGSVDIDHIAELAGSTKEEVINELNGSLVFKNPATHEWETAGAYLSGNVVEKLARVQQSLEVTDEFAANLTPLLEAQPARISFQDITINLGATWIEPDEVRNFVTELFGRQLDPSEFKVRYNKASSQWSVDTSAAFKRNHDANRTTIWGSSRLSFEQLFERLLNSQRPTHYDKTPEGKQVVNVEDTEESRSKMEQINQAFLDWTCADPDRAQRFEDAYNEKCNVIRMPDVDGSRLSFPGLAPGWIPMPHQRDAVARSMFGFNMMAAHPVGAGKTFEMVATSMKLKQLGMVNKPMIAVPNHMLGQMAREAKQMYPAARVLMINNEDLRGNNRKRFLARARNNDWDIVVCTHSILNQIKAPLDITLNNIDRQIDIKRAKAEETDSKRQQRTLEAGIKSLQSQRLAIIDDYEKAEEKGQLLTIDRVGVDMLMVDEAHLYKNLDLHSGLSVKGVTTGGSKRAANIHMLSEYLQSHHGKAFGMNFYTATPISNSMCELFVHNKLLRPDLLDDLDIDHFDEWARRFGKVVTSLEALPEGGGFKVSDRFSQFINVPEMIKLFRSFSDVRSKSELKLPTPKLTTEIVALEQTHWQKLFMEHLTRRAVAIRGGTVDPSVDNILKIATDGRKAAMDMRLNHPDLPADSSSKVQSVAEQVFREYESTMDVKGTQLVFMDLGTPGKKKPFSTYECLKELLIEKGMTPKEVAFIHDAKTHADKEVIFAKVRTGEIRVLVGSTEKMGVGTNVQTRMCALHNVDCPWRPSDIEQRIGRLARRGNEFFSDVKEYRYTTKDSFDLFLWETNSRKQDFITQAMSHPESVSREFSEEMDMGHAEVMAVTTGEPRIKEKVEMDSIVAKLTRDRQVWNSEKVNRQMAVTRYQGELSFLDGRIAAEEQLKEALPKARYKAITVQGTIHELQDGDTTWLYAREVGDAVAARLPMIEARLMRNNESHAPLKMSIGDIELVVQLDREKRTELRLQIDGKVFPHFRANYSKTNIVTGRSLRGAFDCDDRLVALSNDRNKALEAIQQIGAVSSEAVWPRETELAQAIERKIDLDKWFSMQDFNQEKSGPDPFLLALDEHMAAVAGELDTDLEDTLELNQGADQIDGIGETPHVPGLFDDFDQEEELVPAPAGARMG